MFTKLLPALAILVTAATAQAVTVTSKFGAPDPGFSAGESSLVTFDGELPAGFTLTGGYGYRTGSTSEAATPAGDTSRYLYVSSALSPNFATLTTPTDLSRISFYWGSIDTYNSVDVLGAGGAVLKTIGGSAFPPANGDQFTASSNRRVTFTVGTGEVITGLTFHSTGVAFELDSIAGREVGAGSGATVPEPASWAMLVAGFGLIGAATRRRRSVTTVAA